MIFTPAILPLETIGRTELYCSPVPCACSTSSSQQHALNIEKDARSPSPGARHAAHACVVKFDSALLDAGNEASQLNGYIKSFAAYAASSLLLAPSPETRLQMRVRLEIDFPHLWVVWIDLIGSRAVTLRQNIAAQDWCSAAQC